MQFFSADRGSHKQGPESLSVADPSRSTDPLDFGAEPGIPPAAMRRRIYRPKATYALVGINVLLYVAMWLTDGPGMTAESGGHGWLARHFSGMGSWLTPANLSFLDYGASYGVVQNHQWWRLLTATFLHLGPIHLATNMWCLWNLGFIGEPLLGGWGMVLVYALTGIAGNLLGSAIHPANPSAGASGAVMGIGGVLICLLKSKYLPVSASQLKDLRSSVVLFAALNLVLNPIFWVGGKMLAWIDPRVQGPLADVPQIDNMAHLGGLLAGLLMGRLLLPLLGVERERCIRRQWVVFGGMAGLLVVLGFGVASAWS